MTFKTGTPKGEALLNNNRGDDMSEIVECNKAGSCGYGVKHNFVVYPLFESQYNYIKEQQAAIDRLYGALDELCALKDIKDKFGKTEWYLIRQPKAWVKARELIEQHKG